MPAPPDARIYVISKPYHLEGLAAGTRTWWCIERNAVVGELAAVYVTGGQGFRFLFRVLGFAPASEYLCTAHGLMTGEVEIVVNRESPIPAQTLREHPVLRRLPALRRSFQRRSFRLEEPFLGELVKLMKKRASRPRAQTSRPRERVGQAVAKSRKPRGRKE